MKCSRKPHVPHSWSNILALGPDEVGQKGLELLHLWRHSQKFQNPNPKAKKKFFIAD